MTERLAQHSLVRREGEKSLGATEIWVSTEALVAARAVDGGLQRDTPIVIREPHTLMSHDKRKRRLGGTDTAMTIHMKIAAADPHMGDPDTLSVYLAKWQFTYLDAAGRR